jgi:ABC-type Na+ transport system ATPase subunit NatA
VGTGFHPDMTGRENIFLNGTFLGLSKKEIEESFDSIVRFAHVEKFIDTPVKRYSSGMFVRLAFAVAAHLNPDILIVDEVLAVGDMAFQKKCIEKMQQVADSGMTILFVSHNLQMVKKLCGRSILLEKGQRWSKLAILPMSFLLTYNLRNNYLSLFLRSIDQNAGGVQASRDLIRLPMPMKKVIQKHNSKLEKRLFSKWKF